MGPRGEGIFPVWAGSCMCGVRLYSFAVERVIWIGVPSAGVCPNAVRPHRRRCTRRCSCVPACGFVASRALLSAALRAASCWPRRARTLAPPVLRRRQPGGAAARIPWRNHAPAWPPDPRALCGCAQPRVQLRHACPWQRGECDGTHGIRLGTAAYRSNAPGLASARPCLSCDMLN